MKSLSTKSVLLAAAGTAGLAAAGLTVATYPRIGALTYDLSMAAESRQAGLRTRYADVDGLQMAYYEGGPEDAATIVMLHGYTADRDVWVRVAARFVDRYHVVVPDLAGHGDTPFVTGAGFSGPAQATRVARLLDVLGVEQAHVIGNSMGGLVAASFARAYAARTLSVGLSDAVGVLSPEPSDVEVMLERDGNNPFLFHDPREFQPFYAMTMARPPFVPRFVRDAMAQQYVDREPQHAEIFADFFHRDLLDDHLGEITAPAFVVWGEKDQLVHPTAAKVWADGLPSATLITYPGIGHMPMLEDPRRTADDYAAFLDALPG